MLPISQPITAGSIDDCQQLATKTLAEYWLAQKSRADELPRYSSVELMDLYLIAHQMSVKDVIDGGADFSNRFWGTELCRALGSEATGQRVSSYEPAAMREKMLNLYRGIVKNRAPVLSRARIEHIYHRKHVTYEVLHVPYASSNGQDIGQIISVFEFNVPLVK